MLARAAGAANAVDEVLCHFRQIVVDDMGNFLHVDAAGSQVRRYQHAEATLLKAGQCGGTL